MDHATGINTGHHSTINIKEENGDKVITSGEVTILADGGGSYINVSDIKIGKESKCIITIDRPEAQVNADDLLKKFRLF